MKTSVAAALLAGLILPQAASAQECPPAGCAQGEQVGATPWLEVDDEADEIRELEAHLNEILLVDESGKISLRAEFREGLPFPAQRLEMMLATFVELGEDGKVRLRNPEMIRPYLPMIRGFFSQGGLDRLRDLQKLPPEERGEAMRKLFGEGVMPNPFAGPPRPGERRPREERREERRVERERPQTRERAPRDEARPGARERQPREELLARLERIERSVERIERMLEELGSRGFGARPERERARARERGPAGFLRRLFERGEDERWDRRRERRERDEDLRERRERRGVGELLERGRVWNDGLRRLRTIMEPEDMQALGKALRALGGDLDPEALRDPMALFGKLQGVLSPEETARLMEVFSEFLATPEGRALAEEIEGGVRGLEGFVNSPEGARMLARLRELGERLGDGGELPERLEELIRGRTRRGAERAPRQDGHGRREAPSAERHRRDGGEERAQPEPPRRGRLY